MRKLTQLVKSLISIVTLHGSNAMSMTIRSDAGKSSLSIQFSDTHPQIAFGRVSPASSAPPTCSLLYLPGLKSSMMGRKGDFLQSYCEGKSIEYVGMDYRAQGASQGDWAMDACVTNFLTDVEWVLQHVVTTPHTIIVGSSMGGWLGLLLVTMAAKSRDTKLAGLVLLAPAIDMTRYYPDPHTHRQHPLTDRQGRIYYQVPNAYDDQEPYLIYESMLRDGEQNCLLVDTTSSSTRDDWPDLNDVPIRILHGTRDVDVPVERSRKLMSTLLAHHPDAKLALIDGGDHRLSDTQHLQVLEKTLDEVVSKESLSL